jgi:hypothetical protein
MLNFISKTAPARANSPSRIRGLSVLTIYFIEIPKIIVPNLAQRAISEDGPGSGELNGSKA